ncbi:hypothetical protein [Bifidobacterium callimiconis]|uniref:Uncharacterized protein n=1 Tax=Bifidobacterium callimiconis TaxID=2306973 RepID=A0A430FIF2_9BIFI|nr:hypothetical protein [Bifidobacterium callimiconis]RSX52674.1 hypothetical protein D2E23_0402 [Bifidobacterium callimiconis]
MTWFMVDDGIYDAVACEELPLAALGLWVKLGSYVGRQKRDAAYDGTFTKTRIRQFGGTPKLTTALIEAGFLTEADEPGRYRLIESANLCKFAGGAELSQKRAAAGRKGGRKSGQARRSKTEADTTHDNEANASSNNEAIASGKIEAKGYLSEPIPITTPNPSGTKTEPDPSEPDPSGPDPAAIDAALNAIEAVWPKPGGSHGKTRDAFLQALAGDGTGPVNPGLIVQAAETYARQTRHGDTPIRYVPHLANWLAKGTWRQTAPRSRGYEWGGISRAWIHEHIETQLPDGAFTTSLEQTFWASVKGGETPDQAANKIIDIATKGTA